MDITNYIELLEKYNRHRRIIELPKPEYKIIYGENIKGVVFKNKFYSNLNMKK